MSPTGSDANPGTEARPWRTTQKAIDTLNPGQTALFRAGTYGRGECEGAADSGSVAGGFVTLKAYPGERPVLSAGSDGVLYIACDYFRAEGLVIRGPGAVGGTLVYGVSGSDHVEIVGNEVTGSVCQGIYTDEETAGYSITRNRIHHNGTSACDRQAHGIYVQGDGHLIANNLIHDHPEGFGIQHYDYGRNVHILNNTVTHAGHGGIVLGGGGSGPSGTGVAGAVVVNNIVAFNGTFGVDSDSNDPTSCTMHHNLAFSNGSGNYDSDLGCTGAADNLSGDPLFVSVGSRNLTVLPGSPAVNRADAANDVSPAFDGTSRPVGLGPDIGAYER